MTYNEKEQQTMTIDEAIEILKCLLDDGDSPYTDEQCKDTSFIAAKYNEAMRMAITSLEILEDAVSRKEIQERLRRVIEHGVKTNGMHSISAENVLDFITNMPPIDLDQDNERSMID